MTGSPRSFYQHPSTGAERNLIIIHALLGFCFYQHPSTGAERNRRHIFGGGGGYYLGFSFYQHPSTGAERNGITGYMYGTAVVSISTRARALSATLAPAVDNGFRFLSAPEHGR